jgi:DNA-binding NtrC family response regulator
VCDRVLVVDDSDAVREAYTAHFVAGGFEVVSASTLKEAAELLAGDEFDAVITDVSLSSTRGSEGLAIAAYLRQTRPNPPVVVLTAYGQPQVAASAARLGVDAFLHKPVSLVWLESLVRSRLQERRGTPPPEQEMAAAV